MKRKANSTPIGEEKVVFLSAARTLATMMTEESLVQGLTYPPLANIREASARIAARVARIAYASGLAAGPAPDDVLAHVKSHMYEPRYDIYHA